MTTDFKERTGSNRSTYGTMKLLRFEVIDPKYLKYAENVAEQYFEVLGMRIKVRGKVELITFPRNKLGDICENQTRL